MKIERFAGRRFLILLIALISLVIAYPLLHDYDSTSLLYALLATAVFVAGVRAVFTTRWEAVGVLLLGAPTVFAIWVGYVSAAEPSRAMLVTLHGCGALLHAFLVA